MIFIDVVLIVFQTIKPLFWGSKKGRKQNGEREDLQKLDGKRNGGRDGKRDGNGRGDLENGPTLPERLKHVKQCNK